MKLLRTMLMVSLLSLQSLSIVMAPPPPKTNAAPPKTNAEWMNTCGQKITNFKKALAAWLKIAKNKKNDLEPNEAGAKFDALKTDIQGSLTALDAGLKIVKGKNDTTSVDTINAMIRDLKPLLTTIQTTETQLHLGGGESGEGEGEHGEAPSQLQQQSQFQQPQWSQSGQ